MNYREQRVRDRLRALRPQAGQVGDLHSSHLFWTIRIQVRTIVNRHGMTPARQPRPQLFHQRLKPRIPCGHSTTSQKGDSRFSGSWSVRRLWRHSQHSIQQSVVKKQAVIFKVSRKHPPRLLPQAVQPGQPRPLHPSRGKSPSSRQKFKRIPYRQENPFFMSPQILFNPPFLTISPQSNPDKVSA